MPDWMSYIAALNNNVTGFVNSLVAQGGLLFANRFYSSSQAEYALGSNTATMAAVRSTSNPAIYYTVVSGNALVYNGTGTFTTYSNNSAHCTYPITFFVDCEPTSLPSIPNENGFIFGRFSTSNFLSSWGIFTDRTTNKFAYIVYGNSSATSSPSSFFVSDDTMQIGKRYKIFCTLDSALKMSMYIDGIKQSQTATSLTLNSANTVVPLREGATSSFQQRFRGKIYDSKIYDKELSLSEISDYKNLPAVYLTANYDHSEANGFVLNDYRSNTGSLVVIMGGTNDVSGVINSAAGASLQNACDGLRNMIDQVNSFDPNIDVYLSNVLPQAPFSQNGSDGNILVNTLNVLINSMATGYQAGKSNLYFVDMNTLFVGTDGQANSAIMDPLGTHPNDTGYIIMGNRFAGAITSNRAYVGGKILPVGDSITFGFASTDSFGYRKTLQTVLGVGTYNLVGMIKSPQYDSTYDITSEGSGGVRVFKMASINLPRSLNTFFKITDTGLTVNSSGNGATWQVNAGIVNVTTTGNTPRITAGMYNSSGFNTASGVLIEQAATNLVPNSTIDSNSAWSGNDIQYSGVGYWRLTKTDSAASTNSISTNSTYQRSALMSFSHAGTATNSIIFAPISGVSVTTSLVYNYSFMMFCNSARTFSLSNAGGCDLSGTFSVPRSTWVRVSKEFTANSTGAVIPRILLGSGGPFDVYIDQFQVESNNMATTWVPTTTSPLTRNLETLTYSTTGNRNYDAESIFIKFQTTWTGSSGILRGLYSTNSNNRATTFNQSASFTRTNSPDNASNNNYVFSDNTVQVYAGTFQGSGDPNMAIYFNGDSKSASNVDFVSRQFGPTFNIGGDNTTGREIGGIIQSVAIYGVAKTSSQVISITNILNNN